MADLLARLQHALADRYTIERELGAGGMATVYLAQDLKHDRQVALKVSTCADSRESLAGCSVSGRIGIGIPFDILQFVLSIRQNSNCANVGLQ